MVELKTPGTRATLALGCMNFGKRTPAAESERIVARALERGITLFDTANVYNDGESERILGRALRGKRGEVRIATKVGLARAAGKAEGLSQRQIHAAIDASLGRLGADFVDVYYLHAPDHGVPLEETLAAIEELRQSGKIRRFGVSNYAAWQILEMNVICDRMGAPRPVISQVLYNVLIRQVEIEYASFARRHPIHTTVYNPLAGGLLTGRHLRSEETVKGSRFDKNALYKGRYWSDHFFDLVAAYARAADEFGITLIDLSYAWLAGRDLVDSILVGPGKVAHLDAALAGAERELPADLLRRIDAIHYAAIGTDHSYVR